MANAIGSTSRMFVCLFVFLIVVYGIFISCKKGDLPPTPTLCSVIKSVAEEMRIDGVGAG